MHDSQNPLAHAQDRSAPSSSCTSKCGILLTMRVYEVCGVCRNYHHHIVEILDRLSSGIKQKGGRTPVDIADIAQVTSQRETCHLMVCST